MFSEQNNPLPQIQAATPPTSGSSSAGLHCVARQPDCMQMPHWNHVIRGVASMINPFPCDAFIYGGAHYKQSPSDLDIVIFGLPNELVQNLIAYLQSCTQGQGGEPLVPYVKRGDYQAIILKSSWQGFNVDWNILPPNETIFSHASRLDFTIGAVYFNLRTGYTMSPYQQAFTDLNQRTLRTVSLAEQLFRKDPSVIFRMMRIMANNAGFTISDDLIATIQRIFLVNNENLFTGPESLIKPNRLHLEIELLWSSGRALVNLNQLAQWNLLEKVFPHLATLSQSQKKMTWDLMGYVASARDSSTDKEPFPLSLLYCALHQHDLNGLNLDVNAANTCHVLQQYFYEKYPKTTSIWHLHSLFFTNITHSLTHILALKHAMMPVEEPALPIVASIDNFQAATDLENKKAISQAKIVKWLGHQLKKKVASQQMTPVSGDAATTAVDSHERVVVDAIKIKNKTRREILEEKYQTIIRTEQDIEKFDVLIVPGSPVPSMFPAHFIRGHVIAEGTNSKKPDFKIYSFEKTTGRLLLSNEINIDSINIDSLSATIQNHPKMPLVAKFSSEDMTKVLKLTQGLLNPKYQTLVECCTSLIDHIEQSRHNPAQYRKRPAVDRLNESILLAKAYCIRGLARYVINMSAPIVDLNDFNKSRDISPQLIEVDLALWKIKRASMFNLFPKIMASKDLTECKKMIAAYDSTKKEAQQYYQEAMKKNPAHSEIEIGLAQMKTLQNNYQFFLQKKGLICILESKFHLNKGHALHAKKDRTNALVCYEKVMDISDPHGCVIQDKKDAQMRLDWMYKQLIEDLLRQPPGEEIALKLNDYYQKLMTSLQKTINFKSENMANVTVLEDLYLQWGAACQQNGEHTNAKLKYEDAGKGYQRKHAYEKACECYGLINKLPGIASKDIEANDKKIAILSGLMKPKSSDALPGTTEPLANARGSDSSGGTMTETQTAVHAEAQSAGMTLFKPASSPTDVSLSSTITASF